MTVQKFDLIDFHNALAASFIELNKRHNKDFVVEPLGLVGGEYRFQIVVREFPRGKKIKILVNSSIGVDGVSAESGENSIRGWIVDESNQPIGNKTQRWLTRQKGWEDRLTAMLSALLDMVFWVRYCDSCGSLERVYTVKKDGPNKGRLFKKCMCNNSFTWIDKDTDPRGNGDDSLVVPSCPDCGSKMVLRYGSYGDFWGCSTYPDCKGTRQVGQENMPPKEFHDRKAKMQAKLPGENKFVYSSYQEAIFEWIDKQFHPEFADVYIREHGQHLIIQASAGSGKTTTGAAMFRRVPISFNGKRVKCLAVSFTKNSAKDLGKKLPRRVVSSTVHSMGYKSCRNAFGRGMEVVENSNDKTYLILSTYLDNPKQNRPYMAVLAKIVSYVKNTLGDGSAANIDSLLDFYDVDVVKTPQLYADVQYVLAQAKKMTKLIDYDDMVWLPIVLKLPCDKYDLIFLDEAQDTNMSGLTLIEKHMHVGTKLVAVGDPFQAIYGFRGAGTNSMEVIKKTLDNCPTYGLPISYRSPKSGVRLINQHFPEIPYEAAPNAIEGEIHEKSMDAALVDAKDGDLFICRMNAPLVAPCFSLIARGQKAVIYGRDIGKGLISLIMKMEASDSDDLDHKLVSYREYERQRLLDDNREMAAQELSDKVKTIQSIISFVAMTEIVEVDAVIDQINAIFTDKADGVTFGTIHSVKGLEADHTYIISPDLMPHPKASQDWELDQEYNMEYVAYTRHKQSITFVAD